MAETYLPSVLYNSLMELLSKNKLCSWNIHGGAKFTSLTIKFDSTQGSHFESTGYRRKSPSELRRDEQRAALHREQARVLTSTPAEHTRSQSSCVSEDDRRSDISDIGDEDGHELSEAGKEAILKEIRSITASFKEDVRNINNDGLDQCMDSQQLTAMDGAGASPEIEEDANPSLSDSKVSEIMQDWIDKDVTFALYCLKPNDKKKVVQSMRDNGPFVDTIIHDKRFGVNNLVSRTKDFIFVYDINTQQMSDYRVISPQTNNMWHQRDYLKCLVNWPQCDRVKFKEEIEHLKTHIKAFYRSLMKNFHT